MSAVLLARSCCAWLQETDVHTGIFACPATDRPTVLLAKRQT